MTPTAFAKAADVPAARLDGLIARIQRVLNVDGYEILTLSRNENRLEAAQPHGEEVQPPLGDRPLPQGGDDLAAALSADVHRAIPSRTGVSVSPR
jgi:hypothetical protein